MYDVSGMKKSDTIRVLVLLFSGHALKMRLEIPITYLFIHITNFDSYYDNHQALEEPKNWLFNSLCPLFLFLFVCFKVIFIHFLLWQTLMPLTKFIYLSPSCLCFCFFPQQYIREKTSYLPPDPCLSSSTQVVLSYLTAPLLFLDTSV